MLFKFALAIALIPIAFSFLGWFGMIPRMYSIVFSFIFGFIVIYLLAVSIPYLRIVRSQATLCDECIEIRDRRGNIWRTIPYAEIAELRLVHIAGVMDGYHGVNGVAKYIAICSEYDVNLSSGNFRKHFAVSNYFPIFYQEEVYSRINAHCELLKCSNVVDQLE